MPVNSLGTTRLGAQSAPAAAAPPPTAYAGSGESVGHGTIRLHGRAPSFAAQAAEAAPTPSPASSGPVGHGTIRLRG